MQAAAIPEEYLTAIGRVIVNWNHFELVLNLTLIKFLGKDIGEDRSHVVFTHMPFTGKLEVLTALVMVVAKKERNTSLLEKYKRTVLPALTSVSKRRNATVHAALGMADDRVFRLSISAKGGLSSTKTIVSLRDLESLALDILNAGDNLFNLATGKLEAIQTHAKYGAEVK